MFVYNAESKETFTREDGKVLPVLKGWGAQEVVAQDSHNIYVRCGNSYGETPWVQQLSKEGYRFYDEHGKEIIFD